MSMSPFLLIVPIIFVVICIMLPVLIAYFVYQDAKTRGMDAVLWALVAALTPSLIGVIIYLVVRGNYTTNVCAKCGNPAKEQFINCPSCGAGLKLLCDSCGCAVEADWKLCAHCGTQLPQGRPSPVRTRAVQSNRKIWILLLVLILIPVVLIILGFVGFLTLNTIRSVGVY